MVISNNGIILSNPTFISLDYDEDCKYEEVSYSAMDNSFNIAYLQIDGGDLNVKLVESEQKMMPLEMFILP